MRLFAHIRSDGLTNEARILRHEAMRGAAEMDLDYHEVTAPDGVLEEIQVGTNDYVMIVRFNVVPRPTLDDRGTPAPLPING